MASASISVPELEAGILSGDRATLARAITLIESQKSSDVQQAQDLLSRLLPQAGQAHRIGISGVPGVGKSTLIEVLGLQLITQKHRVAVLAVDPSSSLSGGSILGDKSRMPRLAADEKAFIRPSPSGCHLGGVASRTREAMLLCEAAGYDVVLVETMGVGQSETVVADMVDTFLLLCLPGAGDELQAVKRGILEYPDIVAINKADGDNRPQALRAQDALNSALHYTRQPSDIWQPQTVLVSGLTREGLDDLLGLLSNHRAALQKNNALEPKRQEQNRRWMWRLIEERMLEMFRSNSEVMKDIALVEKQVVAGTLLPHQGAHQLLQAFGMKQENDPPKRGSGKARAKKN